MTRCVEKYPTTGALYDDLSGDAGTIAMVCISCVLCLFTLIIFAEEVWYFVHNYKEVNKRWKIIFILGVMPVISATSLLNVLVPTSTTLTELLAALYLSFTVFIFTLLLIDYFGGEKEMIKKFDGDTVSFATPPCCCCCLCVNQLPLTKKTLKRLKSMVLQNCFIRPLDLFVVAVLYANNSYDLDNLMSKSSPGIYLKIINVASTMTAIYGLIVCFKASYPRLQVPRLALKFGALKLAILVFDLQAAIFSMLGNYEVISCYGVRGPHVRAIHIHNGIMVVEMFLIAVMARFAFRITDDSILPTNEVQCVEGLECKVQVGDNKHD